MQTARKAVIFFLQDPRHKDVISIIESHSGEIEKWALSFHGDGKYPHSHLVLLFKEEIELSLLARYFRVPLCNINAFLCSFEAMEAYVTQDGKYPVLKG